MTRDEIKTTAGASCGQERLPVPAEHTAGGKIDHAKVATWPGEALEKTMMADAYQAKLCYCQDVAFHLYALLDRVRSLERALRATGYFQQRNSLPKEGDDPGEVDYFEQWKENVEYTEDVDALLDRFEVPTHQDGKTLWLRERVELLGTIATRRSKLAYRLFQLMDGDYGSGLRQINGDYWPTVRPIWEEAKKEFGIP